MSKKWKARLLFVTGSLLVVTSTIVPVLAPILGPVGVKVATAAGALALLATKAEKLLKDECTTTDLPKP